MKCKVGDTVRLKNPAKVAVTSGFWDSDMEQYDGILTMVREADEETGACTVSADNESHWWFPDMFDVIDTESGTTTRASILYEAKKCVCGKRKEDYGELEDNFTAVGRFWEEYLRDKCVSGCAEISVNAEDVAAMMILLKVARIKTGNGGKDSWVDVAGYAACGGEIAERKY